MVHVVHCRFAGETNFAEVTCLNISQSGMLVRGTVVPAIGSYLDFKFVLENGFEILSGTAKVMRLAPDADNATSVGVAFAEDHPPNPRILARVIELHAPPPVADDD